MKAVDYMFLDKTNLTETGNHSCGKCGYMRNYKVECINCYMGIENLIYICPKCGETHVIY